MKGLFIQKIQKSSLKTINPCIFCDMIKMNTSTALKYQ